MTALIAQARKLILTRLGVALAAGLASLLLVASLVFALVGERPVTVALVEDNRTVSAADLKARAPAHLAGLPRATLTVETASGMDVPATALDARYAAGPRRIDVKIVQSPQLERVVGFGGVNTTDYNRTTDAGYQRRWREAGRILLESLDRRSGAVASGRLSGDFYVMARGEGGVSIEEVRAAVDLFGDEALQGLKRGG